jgi:23S rRNA pseudouridine1911/1915/1917 synthase
MKESSWTEDTRRLGTPVKSEQVGRRLDDYLAEKFPFFSRASWQREIHSGVVTVNGTVARKPAQRLQQGDELRRLHPFHEEPDVDTNMEIIWCDGELAALKKPAGLPMHEAGYYRRRTVAGVLPQILGQGWTPVHRLDRETSGLLLCARQPAVRAQLTSMWTFKQVRKTYLAVTAGIPSDNFWTVDLPIKAERQSRHNRAEISEDGASAITNFRVITRGQDAALIEATPITGKTNQIRLHMAAAGFPLIGDKMYGPNTDILELYREEGNSPRVKELAGFPRHALHAWRLALTHPLTKRELELTCPLPEDLIRLCENKNISVTGLNLGALWV